MRDFSQLQQLHLRAQSFISASLKSIMTMQLAAQDAGQISP